MLQFYMKERDSLAECAAVYNTMHVGIFHIMKAKKIILRIGTMPLMCISMYMILKFLKKTKLKNNYSAGLALQ